MLFDLMVKLFITPENIMSLIRTVVSCAGICLIFNVWGETWWKSLIPFYGNYLIYKKTWNRFWWLFLVEQIFVFTAAKSYKFMKKHVVDNVFDTIKNCMETKEIDINISVSLLIICTVIFLLSTVLSFVLKRVTYAKVCKTLKIQNIFLIIGTFLFPELFLLVDYVYYTKVCKKEEIRRYHKVKYF